MQLFDSMCICRCEFEFQFAHGNFMEDKTTKLLPVVVGEAALKSSTSPTLSHYLKTYIYLEWGSEHFWQKLMYSMPDKGITDTIRARYLERVYSDTNLLLP